MELRKTVRTCLTRAKNGHIVGYLICVCSIMQRASFGSELHKFSTCNSALNMDQQSIQQAELELVIRDFESSRTRVSCDFTIQAGLGKQVMFYFTDVYLGSTNKTDWKDSSCVEIRDANGHYESVPKGLRAIICTKSEAVFAPHVYATEGNALSIRFYRNRGFSIRTYIKMVFTVFRQGSCRTSERKCGNGRCIAHEIVCNNHNPCGDGSDCPTGLEHLSSWAMSGIVILALLSGGIVIIMATVCLQRSGQKRENWDDLFTAGNGVYRQDTNVEVVDVADASGVKHTPLDSRIERSVCRESHKPEIYPLYHEYLDQHNALMKVTNQIIQTNTLTSSPNDLAQTDSDVTIELFTIDGKKSDISKAISTRVSSYKMYETAPDDINYTSVLPKVVQNNLDRSHSDFLNISGERLVLTDSYSGQDDDKIDNFTQKTTTFKPLTMTLTENGNYETKTKNIVSNQLPYFQPPSYNSVAKYKYRNSKIPSNDFKISHSE